MATTTNITLLASDYSDITLNRPSVFRDRLQWTNSNGIGVLPVDFFGTGEIAESLRKIEDLILFDDGGVAINTSGANFTQDVLSKLVVEIVATNGLSVVVSDSSDEPWQLGNNHDFEAARLPEVAAFVSALKANNIESGVATFLTEVPVQHVFSVTGVSGSSASDVKARIKPAPIKKLRAVSTSGPSIGSNALIEIISPGSPITAAGVSSPSVGSASRTTKISSIHSVAGISSPSIGSLAQIRRHRLSRATGILSPSAGSSSEANSILPATNQVVANMPSGPSIAALVQAIGLRPQVPEVLRNLRVLEVGQDYVVLAWDPPDDQNRVDLEATIRFEIQFFGESWQDTQSLNSVFRLTSIGSTSIRAGRTYRVRVREVNSVGDGQPSAVLSFDSLQVNPAGRVLFPQVTVVSERIAEVRYQPPADLGGGDISHYQIAVIDTNGQIGAFENTDGPVLRHQIRGLAPHNRFGFIVRSVNQAGAGLQSLPVYAVMRPAAPRVLFDGQRIPLLDALRQSLILRLDDMDCRLSLWWQPWDEAWYASLEIPTNTVWVEGRRLATNSGLLDRIPHPLTGNIFCRKLDVITGFSEPKINAWSAPTHVLVWERNS